MPVVPLFISMFFLLSSPAHPVHVALTSIEYQKEQQTFDIKFKVFSDDLERAIAEKYNVALKLAQTDETPDEKTYLNKYIAESFKFIVNGDKKLDIIPYGKKLSDASIWLHYRSKCSVPIKKVYIYNTILMDMWVDQTDLVIFKYGKFEKGVSLSRKHYEINMAVE